jgi:hypothetical protein
MAKTQIKPTKTSVKDFIAAVDNDTRREDAKTLLKAFEGHAFKADRDLPLRPVDIFQDMFDGSHTV